MLLLIVTVVCINTLTNLMLFAGPHPGKQRTHPTYSYHENAFRNQSPESSNTRHCVQVKTSVPLFFQMLENKQNKSSRTCKTQLINCSYT